MSPTLTRSIKQSIDWSIDRSKGQASNQTDFSKHSINQSTVSHKRNTYCFARIHFANVKSSRGIGFHGAELPGPDSRFNLHILKIWDCQPSIFLNSLFNQRNRNKWKVLDHLALLCGITLWWAVCITLVSIGGISSEFLVKNGILRVLFLDFAVSPVIELLFPSIVLT